MRRKFISIIENSYIFHTVSIRTFPECIYQTFACFRLPLLPFPNGIRRPLSIYRLQIMLAFHLMHDAIRSAKIPQEPTTPNIYTIIHKRQRRSNAFMIIMRLYQCTQCKAFQTASGSITSRSAAFTNIHTNDSLHIST